MENNGTKYDVEARKAATEHANKEVSEVGPIYDKVFEAFLAGAEFQRTRYKDPDKEYYGF